VYALGDAAAQGLEHAAASKSASSSSSSSSPPLHGSPPPPPGPFRLDWTRTAIFGIFGTVIGGPAYSFWFGWLDTLPLKLYQLRQMRQRAEILRAYNLLKRHGIEVNLVVDKLPNAQPLGKWTQKAFKIAFDQLIFSSAYTLVFFMGVGAMKGGAEKWQADLKMRDLLEWEAEIVGVKRAAAVAAAAAASSSSSATAAAASPMMAWFAPPPPPPRAAAPPTEQEELERALALLKEKQLQRQLSWGDIWQRAWAHTKDVYLETYIIDCVVWPPLQLINFTFIPLRYQVLYVNACNLAWNTYLSLMSGKGH